ncbi:hypothetical protein [Mesorhizobium sp. NZP2077]|uniref:hypothetical protein n=1 Tax=Mesorhizobium sp. NZP2077 TaxID=2483404 RepID=UPI0015582AC3|nr:hypothetical protein [Mesorhizobium sp. NZP2077]QKC83953.1 hypothetical protein EB232_22250 [Mesorhizobium sp. NZP2077]QKD17490.1 hypothetical protein HGP13_21955 [Mesorhizobium sp. NZP2077]
MIKKPQTYWTERAEAADAARREQQLAIARNLIIAGIEAAFLITGSGLEALEETETAMGAFLAAHGAQLTAEVEAIETQGSA